MNADTRGWLLAPLVVVMAGCLDFGPNINTTTPTAEQIAGCRKLMHLNADCDISPQGFKLTSGIDDAIWFVFVAEAASIDEVFDSEVVDTTSFTPGFSFVGGNAGQPSWWDAPNKPLVGEGSIELPGVKFMNVGYVDNGDGTLKVYIMWHEV